MHKHMIETVPFYKRHQDVDAVRQPLTPTLRVPDCGECCIVVGTMDTPVPTVSSNQGIEHYSLWATPACACFYVIGVRDTDLS